MRSRLVAVDALGNQRADGCNVTFPGSFDERAFPRRLSRATRVGKDNGQERNQKPSSITSGAHFGLTFSQCDERQTDVSEMLPQGHAPKRSKTTQISVRELGRDSADFTPAQVQPDWNTYT